MLAYFVMAAFVAAGVWTLGAWIAAVKKMDNGDTAAWGWFVFIAGAIIGLIWPISLFIGFWSAVIYFAREKLKALFAELEV